MHDAPPEFDGDAAGPLQHIARGLRPLAVPIAGLSPDPANARTHDDRNIAAIASSLRQFGQRKPIVVQSHGMIVRAGNGTLAAALSLGWTHIAAVICDDSATAATAFAIADNRTAELAAWDEVTLARLLDGLRSDGADLSDLGWSDDELSSLLAQETDMPELPAGDRDEDSLRTITISLPLDQHDEVLSWLDSIDPNPSRAIVLAARRG